MADEEKTAQTVVTNGPGGHDGHASDETTTVSSSKDLDETYGVYQQDNPAAIDPGEARRVLRTIDWNALPLLMGSYMLQYLDKSSINFASVYALQAGTRLKGRTTSGSPPSSTLATSPPSTPPATCCSATRPAALLVSACSAGASC